MTDATWLIKRVSGDLPDRNVTLAVAEEALTWSDPETVEITPAQYSPYFEKAEQGATIMPRPFWFVEPVGASGSGWRRLRTPEQQARNAKDPWTGLQFEGRIENQYLYVTFLELFPFLLGPPKLVALPVKKSSSGHKLELLEIDDVAGRGTPNLADWMRTVESTWQERKKDSQAQDTTSVRYLNNHNNLVRQNLSKVRLVYSGKGTNLRAAVLQPSKFVAAAPVAVQGFVVDQNFYEIWAPAQEAHYLSGILNTDYANNAIKATQTQGAFGARDIHRRPFEVLPIPAYDSSDKRHRRLASISMMAHEKLEGSTGNTRRNAALAPVRELVDESDKLAADVCGVAA